MDDLVARGSQTARDGFRNERDIRDKLLNWRADREAQCWLEVMGYDLQKITNVNTDILHGYKTDVTVQIRQGSALSIENIQVKLVSNERGFNQVDKRWLRNYRELWDMPESVYTALRYFTGELRPYRLETRDPRRMFLDEMTAEDRNAVTDWFREQKSLVLSDIIEGRGQYRAGWILVAQKIDNNARWVLKPISEALRHYAEGAVAMTPRGSLSIGKVTVQRKGGDNGRETANMLQFKLDPTELFDT